MTLPEIAEALEGAIRIIEEESSDEKNAKLFLVSVALGKCLDEIERLWEMPT